MIATRKTRVRVRSWITLGVAVLITVTSAQSTDAKSEAGGASSLSIDDVQIVEGTSGTAQALVPIRLNKSVGQVVTVDVVTAPGSATAGSDYSTVSTRAVFNRRQTVAYVAIPILTDLIDEPDEQFTAVLSAPVGASIGDETGVITIIDDDEPAPLPPPPPTQTDVRLVLTDDENVDQLLTGDDVRYTLAVNNLGPVAAAGVTVVDRLPDGLAFRSADPTCVLASDGETVTCTRPSPLEPNDSWAPTIVATILVNDMVVNTAQVTSSTPDSNVANNSDSELTTSVTPNAHVKVANISVSGTVMAGWNGAANVVDIASRYVVSVGLENAGPTRADGVVVELFDDEAWTVLGSSCQSAPTEVVNANGPPAAVACVVGSMAVGETRTVYYDLSFNHLSYNPNTPGAVPYEFASRALSADVRTATPGQPASQYDGTKSYIAAHEDRAWIEPSFATPTSARVGSEVHISGRLRSFGPWFLNQTAVNIDFPSDLQFVDAVNMTCGPPQQGSTGGTRLFCTHDGRINAGAVSDEVRFTFRPTLPGPKSVGIWVYDRRNIAWADRDNQVVGFNVALI